MPIIKMWIDCSTGMIQLIDWTFTLMPVVWSHSAKSRNMSRSGAYLTSVGSGNGPVPMVV